jgi:predicted Zn-dependent protease with MMP-like domain
VAASTPVVIGPVDGRRDQRRPGRFGEAGAHAAHRRDTVTAFADGVGKRNQIVVIAVGRQRTRMSHELPPAWCGDASGVQDAQIPRMRFRHRGQRSDDGSRVRIDEGQRRHGVVRAPGPAAATGNVHAREAIAQGPRESPDTRGIRRPMCNRYDLSMSDPRSRRGREMRGPLLPPTVPGWRSRAERFDMAVLEAYEPIERRWAERVSSLDVAVDEIPRIAPKDPENVQWPPEVIADGPIALARLIPAGVDVRGNSTRARIVLFRKPIERRAKDSTDLGDLLHEILVAQVATYLGVEPSVIDPTIDDD